MTVREPHEGYKPRDEQDRKSQPRVPRFAVSLVAVVAVCVLVVVSVALLWARHNDEVRRAACARIVVEAEDDRAMWVWLIDNVNPANELVDEARAELDRRLPRLACTGDGRVVRLDEIPATHP